MGEEQIMTYDIPSVFHPSFEIEFYWQYVDVFSDIRIFV